MGFIMQIRPEILKKLREDFPHGSIVELISMNDPYRNMPAGMQGKVLFVDDAGGIHVSWENGSSLAVLYGIDQIRRLR